MQFENYLYPTQENLFRLLKTNHKGHIAASKKKSFLLVKGTAPVLLVAHLDTVHKDPVKTICRSDDGNILISPEGIGGDDRCGVYALETVYEKSEEKPWLLFTCDEEIGGFGAEDFALSFENKELPEALKAIKLIVEIDRKGANDAVYYSCDCPELEAYMETKGFQTAQGSFSDISIIAPVMGIAAVNLSSGYYNAHTQHEYINREELDSVIQRTIEIVAEATQETFPVYKYKEKYVPKVISSHNNYFGTYGSKGTSPCPITNPAYAYTKEKYEALLDIYTKKELNKYIKAFGEIIIHQLYEEEFEQWNMFDSRVNEAINYKNTTGFSTKAG